MLTPEEISSRSFLVSLRGYDRDEVHAFLAQVAEDLAALQVRLTELEDAASAPAAADAPAAPAAEPASPSQLFAEIGRETQRILEAAQAVGDDLRRKAQDEAAGALDAAKAEAGRELKAARAESTRVIADGERRREAMEEAVAGLAAARDALAGDLREVGRTVERTLRDLTAEPEVVDTMRQGVASSARAEAAEPVAGGEEEVDDAEPPAENPQVDGAEGTGPVESDAEAEAEAAELADADADAEAETAELADVDVDVDVDADADVAEPSNWSDEEAGLIEQAQALRAQALAPLHPKLVRKLKRGLQDLQNGMLDRIRRAEGRGEGSAFVPDEAAVATLAGLAEEFLVTAWWAGAASGELLEGAEVDVRAPAESLGADLTAGIAEQLLAGLTVELEEGLGAGEDVAALTERVGRVFSNIREAPVEEGAAISLLSTYEEGLLAAWQVGQTTHRHWALATEPPCVDPRCAENHRAGPAPLGSPFASGHRAPPVRVGCNCTTVPAVPVSEPES